MAYDIYGNNLRRGYCEVHPNVHEEYPCSLCYQESYSKSLNKSRVDKNERDYWEAFEKELEHECAIQADVLYTVLFCLSEVMNRWKNKRLQSLKDKGIIQ